MRHLLLSLLCVGLLVGSPAAHAQKFAYIDSDYVLLHMPEYAEAQNTLNQLAIDWQAEVEEKLVAVGRLEAAYRAERVLLTGEMRAKREEEIEAKRAEAKALQKERFGPEGELFRKRKELIQPVQDKIFEELMALAESGGYMVIFDKTNQSNMLYTNPKYDISDRLIKALGYVPGETIESGKEGEKEGDGKEGEGKSLQDKAKDAVGKGLENAREGVRGATESVRGGGKE